MKASELRIGNRLITNGGVWVAVNEIRKDCLIVQHFDSIQDPEPYGGEWEQNLNISGIPLTEEWLLKFGFKKPLDWHSWRLTLDNSNEEQFKSSLQLGFTGCGYVQVCRSGITAYDAKCEFVHQLQNLYFALTSEELTLKEK